MSHSFVTTLNGVVRIYTDMLAWLISRLLYHAAILQKSNSFVQSNFNNPSLILGVMIWGEQT
jgi:hypothetical protein